MAGLVETVEKRQETPLSWLHEGHQQGQWREDGMATILNLASASAISRPGKRLQFANLKMAIDSGFTYQ